MKRETTPKGFGIIEIIVTLALTSVVVIVIGRSLVSLQRVYDASTNRSRAFVHAHQPIEIIDGLKNAYFGCSCSVGSLDSCSATACTRAADGQSCSVVPPYTSCWTEYPKNQNGVTRFEVKRVGSDWLLRPLAVGTNETITGLPSFQRSVDITNLNRNASGDIDSVGTPDFNTKQITATVRWEDHGQPREITQTLILTAWENF